jgi:photosystem II stability/assembly factor-like uncharacterized protein
MNTTNGRGLRGALSATALCLGLAAGAFADDPPSWTWSGWGGGGFFWSAVFDPSNADVIYMGGDVVGLYKTTDRGANWRFINRGLHEYGVYSLAVSKSDPKVLYAMTPNGMARSANGGEDWQALPETLKAAQNLSTHRPGSVRAIAVDPTTADTVYAGSGTGSLCKSTDGGQTWTALDYLAAVKKDAPAASAIAAASGAGFAWLNYESAGGDWKPHGRVEKYLNNGEDWSAFNRLTARAYAPAGAPKLTAQLVLQSGGDWAWQQGTEAVLKPGEWTEVALDLSTLKGLDAARMAHVVVRSAGVAWQGELGLDAVTLHPADAAHPPRVIGDWEKPGALDGWRLSTAKDAPFVRGFRTSAEPPPNVKAPIGAVAVAESDPRRIFVAHRQLGIFRSVDAGTTWTHMDTPRAAAHVTVFPSDAQFVFGAFGTNGVWKSSDGGATWASAAGNLPAKCEAREVVVDPRDPQVLHLIGREGWNGQFFSTRDGGATWTSSKRFQRDFVANPTLPAETGSGEFATGIGGLSTPSNLALSPSEPDVLFIAANWNNVLSTDSGRTWNERVRGADITCFHDLRFVGNRIYAAAMDEGLLMSEDDGATWKQLAPLKYSPGTSGHQWRHAPHRLDRLAVASGRSVPERRPGERRRRRDVQSRPRPAHLPAAGQHDVGPGLRPRVGGGPEEPECAVLGHRRRRRTRQGPERRGRLQVDRRRTELDAAPEPARQSPDVLWPGRGPDRFQPHLLGCLRRQGRRVAQRRRGRKLGTQGRHRPLDLQSGGRALRQRLRRRQQPLAQHRPRSDLEADQQAGGTHRRRAGDRSRGRAAHLDLRGHLGRQRRGRRVPHDRRRRDVAGDHRRPTLQEAPDPTLQPRHARPLGRRRRRLQDETVDHTNQGVHHEDRAHISRVCRYCGIAGDGYLEGRDDHLGWRPVSSHRHELERPGELGR